MIRGDKKREKELGKERENETGTNQDTKDSLNKVCSFHIWKYCLQLAKSWQITQSHLQEVK